MEGDKYFSIIYPEPSWLVGNIFDNDSHTFLPNLSETDYIVEECHDDICNRYVWPAYYNSKTIQCTGSGLIGGISGETLQIFNSGDLVVYNNSYSSTPSPPSSSDFVTYELVSQFDSVDEIGIYSFRKAGMETIRLPYGCKKIGENAFDMCSALTTVFLYEDVEIFDRYAFRECTNLTNTEHSCADGNSGVFKFGKHLKEINTGCFEECESLARISFSSTNSEVTIGDFAFAYCSSLNEMGRSGHLETNIVKIPSFVKLVGNDNFNSCTSIKEVYFENASSTKIPPSAFFGCNNLTKLSCASGTEFSSVYEIGQGAFGYCAKLKEPENICTLFNLFKDGNDGVETIDSADLNYLFYPLTFDEGYSISRTGCTSE